MVMVSGVVNGNPHRRLDVAEFRGFVLSDALAPLIFLNGADSKAAQMFTLAHELAHLWLGVTGVSDTESGRIPEKSSERWCNQVAAELLAPLEAVTSVYQPHSSINEQLPTLVRKFKVSTLVVLRRLCDAGFLTPNQLWQYHHAERQRLINLQASKSGGGDFYRALPARNSKRFVKALITSTLEGQTLYRDAFRMLNLQKISSFEEIARRLELLL